MPLNNDLIMQFVKATKDPKETQKETIVYGVIVESDKESDTRKYVKIDGSDLYTPIETTSDIRTGDRVTVMIKNHTATVTGNLTEPSGRSTDVRGNSEYIKNLNIVVANKVSAEELDVERARITGLEADKVKINETLVANKAAIESLQVNKLDADEAALKYATIQRLDATDLKVSNLRGEVGDFKELSTDKFEAIEGTIGKLNTTYANIDFTNIGKAAMEYFYAQSGLIKNVVVGDQTITGELVGVTISGDRLLGNTIIAEKLVIKGSDGLYYKLNTDGMKVEAEQTDENSINGQVIKAKSITASKISVNDLVAFDATIGGFNIGTTSLYSGVKSSVGNTTRGIYMDTDGQLSVGDSKNFLKYYKDANGNYRLEISAKSVLIGDGSSNIESTITEIQNVVNDIEIGGRNLLVNTKELSGFYSNNAETGYIVGSDGFTYANFPVVTTLSYRAISSTYSMLAPEAVLDRQVVFSFELRSDTAWEATDGNLIVGFAFCNDSSTTRLRYRTVYPTGTIGTKWTRFDVKATINEEYLTSGTTSIEDCTRFYVQIYNYSLNHLQVRKPKLEYGNKATDWTPAPEDVQTAIDAVKVGGRNLLRYTAEMPIVTNYTDENGIGVYVTGAGTLTDTGDGVKLTYDSSGRGAIAIPLAYDGAIENNETVTISFDYRGNMTRSCYHYFLTRTSPNVTIHGFPALKASTNEWMHYEYTFSHAEANARTCYSFMMAYNPGTDWAGTWVEIKKGSLKLERGHKATDWTPASEDVDSNIEDASKVAKNFMHHDSSNGLQIGDISTGVWKGFRTQITNAAFRILNSTGTVLASYGEKIVELGRNAADAVIKLCGGKGEIAYATDDDSGDDYLQMSADKLRLKSSEMSSLYSMYTDESTRWEKSAVNVSPTKVSMYASECIDPSMVEKVEGWAISEFDIDGTDITGSANKVTLTGQNGAKISAPNGNIELYPNGRLYSSRQILVSSEAKTKHNDGIKGWYIGADGTAHATHATGGSSISFHFAGSTATTSTIAESASGEIKINGMRFGVNKILWSGASYMNSTHTVTLNEGVSKQANGIVLVFSYYDNETKKAMDHSFTTHFVPKKEVELFPGCGHTYLMAINAGFSSVGAKYLTFTDTVITGHSGNVSSGTNSGITFNNSNYVLRYVIGV